MSWNEDSYTQPFDSQQATEEWVLGLKYFLTKKWSVLTACSGLIPCVGISFPVLGSLCVSLFYLSMCALGHLGTSTTISTPSGKAVGSFIMQRKRGCVQVCLPASAARRDPMVIGSWFLLLKLICSCMFSVSKMLFQAVFLCVKGQNTTE